MSEPLTRPGMQVLTLSELAKFMAEAAYTWHLTPPDTPDRHKDYLPLNLWDQIKDGP